MWRAILIAVLFIGACESTPADEAPTSTSPDSASEESSSGVRVAQIGESIELSATGFVDQPGTTARITVSAQEGAVSPGPYEEVSPDAQVLAFRVDIEVLEGEYSGVPQGATRIVDSEGFVYDDIVHETSAGPGFNDDSLRVPPDQTRSGWIAFTIPEDVTPAMVEFSMMGDQVGQWAL